MRLQSNHSASAVLLALLVSGSVSATTYHVAKTGNDGNAGTSGSPYLTINKAAQVMQAGDSVIVHAGEYREWVQPARGGSSESARITYKTAPGEIVQIKGSERITSWVLQSGNVWKADIPDAFFGSFNPFSMDVRGAYPGEGDQYLAGGQWCHLGEVYLDGQYYQEQQSLTTIQSTPKTWYISHSGTTTSISANFGTANPNTQLAEINVREAVFGHPTLMSGIDYITVDGFRLSQSADAWCPPYRSSPSVSKAVIYPTGTNWLIKNCNIRLAKTRGICLDGGSGAKNHIVRDNVITECGIAGIAGCYADGSIISGNWISDIHGSRPYYGDEHGGVKTNLTSNLTICGNVIRNVISPGWGRLIMGDWCGTGWRVTGNLLIESTDAMIYEYNMQNNGIGLVDNNIVIGNTPTNGDLNTGNWVFAQNLFYTTSNGTSTINLNMIFKNDNTITNLAHVADTAAKTVTLTFTASSAVATQTYPIVTTATIGPVAGKQMTNPDGSPLSLDVDMLNHCRVGQATRGPIQNIKTGVNTFVFRPNDNFLDKIPCTGNDVTPPTAPTNLSAQASGAKTINLTWSAAIEADGEISGYSVYRGGQKVASVNGTSYSDSGLTESTTYTYQVSAVNTSFLEGPKSTQAQATTLADHGAPTIVAVTSNGSATSVKIVFDESVEQSSAQNAANYAIDNAVTVSAASLGSDLKTVTLTTSTLSRAVTYTLTVNNVRDRAAQPNTIAANSKATFMHLEGITKIRFYPRAALAARMVGGIFEGSNGVADAGPYTTLYTVSSTPTMGWNEVTLAANDGFRYVRYNTTSGFGNVAEVEFYTGTEKLVGAPFGTPGTWAGSGNDFTKVFDGDVNTFFDCSQASAYAGLDLQGGATMRGDGRAQTASGVSPFRMFTKGTTIRLVIDGAARTRAVSVSLYDLRGALIRSLSAAASAESIILSDGSKPLRQGQYILLVKSGSFEATRLFTVAEK
jgi:hypothetical protein